MVPRWRMISAPTWARHGFAGEWRWNWCILHGLSRTPAPTNSVLAHPVVGVGVLDDPCGTYRMECRSRTNTRFVQSSRRGRRPWRPLRNRLEVRCECAVLSQSVQTVLNGRGKLLPYGFLLQRLCRFRLLTVGSFLLFFS